MVIIINDQNLKIYWNRFDLLLLALIILSAIKTNT